MIKPKHILIVSSEFPPQPGGIGNHAYNLGMQLSKHGYGITVISDSRSVSGELEATFDAALPFKVIRISVSFIRSFMYVKRLYFLWRHIRHNELVIASGKFSLWSVGLFSLFFNKRYLAIIHGSEVNLKSVIFRKLTAMALRRFQRIIAVSNYTKGLVEQFKRDCIKVIPNGFDASKWTDEPLDKSLHLKGSPKLITVGRISERKGQINVIRHLPELLKLFPEVHYHCVGIANSMDACLKTVKALGLEDYVTFHGEVPHQELKQLLKASDIFVMLNSETKSGDVEGFGIAVIEANALGIPAIGARGSGVEMAILEGKSGILINGMDTDAFISAISNIMHNKSKFREASVLWAEQHRWDKVVKLYIDTINAYP
ncbi:glycosyltransferase family 4 protein [Aestuariivivens sp. NBU2969]|uniref:glycosyltransferase family 4 protein n=1 Tax=Aestuariivivens sp. NBU2969 TaxID=2873267 RepID=UPI001CBF897C|nr:glycosyltransferase family 4 protein [Aestuariivivens sp. NBU2969]